MGEGVDIFLGVLYILSKDLKGPKQSSGGSKEKEATTDTSEFSAAKFQRPKPQNLCIL